MTTDTLTFAYDRGALVTYRHHQWQVAWRRYTESPTGTHIEYGLIWSTAHPSMPPCWVTEHELQSVEEGACASII